MTDAAHSLEAAQLQAVASIASAYFSRHMVDVGKIGEVIGAIHSAVVNAGAPAEEPPEELKPAVPVRKSVTPEAIICLEDGKAFKSLKRHLRTAYGLSPEDYRERWGLPADYPMVAPLYSAKRSQLAKDSGLGKKAA